MRLYHAAAPLMLCVVFTAAPAAQQEARWARDEALRRAQVRLPPPLPIRDARFDTNPDGPGAFAPNSAVACRFVVEPASGTSPKFDCQLPDGEVIRVKYGARNPEVYAEVAASRLLAALGFPTDLISVVERVSCFGCPPDPFPLLQGCWRDGKVESRCVGPLRFEVSREFSPVIVERKFPGEKIDARRVEGWAWHELDLIRTSRGGAARADIDALRLLAVFLAHWDNKADNQRLLCMDAPGRAGTQPCRRALVMIADLGATFGPPKASLAGWAAAPIWDDRARCTISMRTLPYGGSTFRPTVISEAGRQLAGSLLGDMSDTQIRQLFVGARFDRTDEWARTFQEKRRLIQDGPACPQEQ